LQTLENKALSQGIIGKSAPILAEITIWKSQMLRASEVCRSYLAIAYGFSTEL